MKVLFWNINGRSKRTITEGANQFIFKNLVKHNSDIVVLAEYVPEAYIELEERFSNEGYVCYHSNSNAGIGNQILVAYRKELFYFEYSFELNEFSPDYFSLNLVDHQLKRFVVGGTRIKIGGNNLFEDFKDRRHQFDFLTDKLKDIKYPFAVLGDFNNGYFDFNKDDIEQNFAGKPREFYSYPYIKKHVEKNGITLLTPEEGFSWKNNFKLDHCLFKNATILSANYDFSFIKDSLYKNIIGYPDHAQLLVNLK